MSGSAHASAITGCRRDSVIMLQVVYVGDVLRIFTPCDKSYLFIYLNPGLGPALDWSSKSPSQIQQLLQCSLIYMNTYDPETNGTVSASCVTRMIIQPNRTHSKFRH